MASKFNRFFITLSFFGIGGFWIIFSNTLHDRFYALHPVVPPFIEVSHWLFLSASTVFLYLLLHYWYLQQSKPAPLKPHQKLKKSLQLFREHSDSMVKSDDEITIMVKACQLCVEEGGHIMAWIAAAGDDKEKSLKPIAHYGPTGCFFDNYDATWDNTEKGKCPAGTSIRIGEPIIYQDLMLNSRFKHRRESAKRSGFGSCISIPLWDELKVTGALVVFNSAANAFDLETVKVLEELAYEISAAATNVRKNREHSFAMDEHHMLAAITEQTTDGVITFSPNGIIQYVNSSFIEMCRIPINKVVGVSIHDFECSKRNPIFYQALLSAIAAKGPKTGRFVNRDGNGEEHDIDARISPVFDKANKIVRYVTTVRDITNEVQLQRELQQSQKMEALATLSGTIIHAFQKQLVTISTNSKEGLNDDVDNATFQEKFLSIFKASQNGNKLVDHFTAISSQSDQSKQLVNLADVVNKCIVTLRTKIPPTIKIDKKFGANLGLISANKKQISLAIMNLCSNAIDAMQPSGGKLEISLFNSNDTSHNNHSHTLTSLGQLKLTITDTGQGMDRKEIGSIFDPFYTTKGQDEGLGLGLSITKQIVKQHGGDISVNSIVGVGTSFALLIPRQEHEDINHADSMVTNSNYIDTRETMYA